MVDIVYPVPIGMAAQLYKYNACSTTYFSGLLNPVVLGASQGTKAVEAIGTLRSFLESEGLTPGTSKGVDSINDMKNVKTFYTGDSLPVVKEVNYNSTWRMYRSKADFEKMKKAGNIVVTPMRKVSGTMSDVLSISGGQRIASLLVTAGTRGTQIQPAAEWVCTRRRKFYQDSAVPKDWYYGDTGGIGSRAAEWQEFDFVHVRNPVVTTFFADHAPPDLHLVDLWLQQQEQYRPLINGALDELYSGVYDVLTELGELPETVSYLYSILRRLVLLFIGIKSREAAARQKFQGKELIDEIASLWMQYRYAASPLVYSLEDGLKLLNTKTVEYQSTRKRVDEDFTITFGEYTFSGTIEARVFGKMRIDALARTANLGLNPIKTLWELTPLSFVLDWVLPIGEMLGALVAPTHEKETALTGSIRVRSLQIKHSTGIIIPCSFNFYDVKNISGPTRPFPNVFFNWKRALDSLALAWGLFLKQHWKS